MILLYKKICCSRIILREIAKRNYKLTYFKCMNIYLLKWWVKSYSGYWLTTFFTLLTTWDIFNKNSFFFFPFCNHPFIMLDLISQYFIEFSHFGFYAWPFRLIYYLGMRSTCICSKKLMLLPCIIFTMILGKSLLLYVPSWKYTWLAVYSSSKLIFMVILKCISSLKLRLVFVLLGM